jgi:uncharacterized protein (TIGR02996 family)
MTIESDLLERICAEPSNIDARLVYADSLIERDDPRGTFIAQQCALERLDSLDERYAPMLASSRRLEAASARKWIGDDALLHPVFQNGFLRRIAMRPDQIAEHWPPLAAREPIEGLEVLVGEGIPEEQRDLAMPAGLRALKVSPERWFTSHSVGQVLAWGMPALRELDLSRCDLGSTGCELLANIETDLATSFPGWRVPPPFANGQIERLILHGCSITDAGARIQFAADSLAGIQELDVGQCRLREKETLEAIRSAPRMASLVRLSISGNNDLADHLGVLAGWEVLPRLERIAVPQAIVVKDLEALFPAPSSRLRVLDLASAKALLKTPAAVAAIAEALTHLDVGTTSVGDAGFAELLAAPSVTRVLELHANGCSLSDKAIGTLTASSLRRLVTLDLSSNKLTDEGLRDLAAWPGLEHVTHLRIGNNRKVSADGYEALAAAARFVPVSFDIGKSSDEKLKARLHERFGAALVVG